MAPRGFWKLGAIGCRGASWSEQLEGKELRREGSYVLGTVFTLLHLLHCGTLILKVYSCAAVTIVMSHMTLYALRTRA